MFNYPLILKGLKMARKRPGTFYTFSIFSEHLPRPTRSREEHIRCMEMAEF
jgi:hypothetical protein